MGQLFYLLNSPPEDFGGGDTSKEVVSLANVKSYNTRIKLKRDTSANWEKANPVLLQGEMILVETTSGTIRRKIGDGTKTYTQLPFDDEAIYNSLGQKAAASDLTTHVSDTANPHGVTKEQVGLGNVPNVATNDQTPTYTAATSRSAINSGEKLSVTLGKIKKWLSDLGTLAFKSTVAKSDLDTTVQTSLNKADSALQSYTETDPTVPAWAKAASKPTYDADEVGAAPASHSHDAATRSVAGFLSVNDKKKLDGIQESADAVSVSRFLSSGTKIATITINGTGTDLYCEKNTDNDTKVTQSSDTSTTGTVPILLAYQASPTSGTAGAAKYTSKAGVKPSTGQFVSTVATGTAPMTVSSKTVVTNFNADQLDGYDAASFVLATDYAALETALAAI